MAHEPRVSERLDELEQVIVRQSDRISALEDELRILRMMLTRALQGAPPEAEAA
jgi:hypothetical protein